MSIIRHAPAAVVLAAASFTALAQTATEHAQHHPNALAPASTPTAPTAPQPDATRPMAAMPSMAAMDARMKEMQAMHERMANAKTPEERNALMAEHMKTMQGGMTMMNQMRAGMGHMGGPGGMGAMQGGKPLPGNMAERQQMLERRMDMMQSMMQMMMDRMPPAPPAK